MESYYCYELGESGYAGALLGDKRHWVRRLPGKLLHNIISHGIARIAEFLTSESPQVMAYGFTSPFLKSIGENEIIDELRVIICEDERSYGLFHVLLADASRASSVSYLWQEEWSDPGSDSGDTHQASRRQVQNLR